jgi:hypothetical protein
MHQTTTEINWQLARQEGRVGTGNWRWFPKERLQDVFQAAEDWKMTLKGVEWPWLCWCVDEEWCYLQQRLVSAVGWTPVVGTDGHISRPRLFGDAVFVDFNARLKLPVMWMHFPLEFVFAFTERLGYWHSDVLPPLPVMHHISQEFSTIWDGQLIGIKKESSALKWIEYQFRRFTGMPLPSTHCASPAVWLERFRKRRQPFYKSWTEIIGCTTAGASRSQWDSGTGWWRCPQHHPNAHPIVTQRPPHWEHGVGIWLWERHFNGRLRHLSVDVEPWHYSPRHPNYIRQRADDRRIEDSKREELRRSFDLSGIKETLHLPQ